MLAMYIVMMMKANLNMSLLMKLTTQVEKSIAKLQSNKFKVVSPYELKNHHEIDCTNRRRDTSGIFIYMVH